MSCTAVTKVKPFHRASLEPTSATCRRQKNISPCLFVLNSTLQKHSHMYTGPILLLVLSYIMYMHHACNINRTRYLRILSCISKPWSHRYVI